MTIDNLDMRTDNAQDASQQSEQHTDADMPHSTHVTDASKDHAATTADVSASGNSDTVSDTINDGVPVSAAASTDEPAHAEPAYSVRQAVKPANYEPEALLADVERLKKLADINMMDSPIEEAFDRLTRLASKIIGVPVSLVSLIDADRQFMKSSFGLDPILAEARMMPLSYAICRHVTALGEPIIAPDTLENEITKDDLIVRDFGLRSYLGMPLKLTDGTTLGSFCAIDYEPHEWTENDIEIMRELAASVMTEIELRVENRKRNEAEAELILRKTAIESSNAGISIADKRLPDMPLIYVNESFTRSTGYSYEEAIGHNCRFLQGDNHDQKGLDTIRAAIKSGESCEVTLRNYRKDGTPFWNDLRISPIRDDDGVVTHYVGVSDDVTERIELQNEREGLISDLKTARRIAEENSRLKSDFLATMSHELRTPMNAIEGFTSIMLNKMGGAEYNEKTERYLNRINGNSQRLLKLINDFLDLSRIESGRLELVSSPFSARRLVELIRDGIGSLAEQKKVGFSIEVDENLPEMLLGDDEAISKIIVNLLGNAIKFTKEGGVILKLKSDDENWQIIVSDTGIGIPPHAREYIFDEFRQVDQTSKREFGGSGLGLAITQRLVRAMNGTIVLDSEVGEGSTFTVTLPLHEAQPEM